MMGISGNRNPSYMGSNSSDSDMDDDSMDSQEDDGKGGKLLALQNMIGAIADISDDELRPYIENLKNQIHMGHEAAEGDDLGVQEAQEHDEMDQNPMNMSSKPGLDVSIGVGSAKPGMKDEMNDQDDEQNDSEDESGMPKGGFLAILSKRMNQKGK